MSTEDASPLEMLVLLRVACASGGRESFTATRRALEPYLAGWLGPAARHERLEEARLALGRRGHVSLEGTRSTAVTAPGRRVALEMIGVDALPLRRAWVSVRDTDAIARALGLSPPRGPDRRRLRRAEGLRAAVLRRAHALPLSPLPTGTRTAKALAWRRLGHLLGRELDPDVAGRCGSGPVIEVLASDVLADGRRRPLRHVLARAAAEAVGARTTGAADLRRAVLTHWVRSAEAPTAAR